MSEDQAVPGAPEEETADEVPEPPPHGRIPPESETEPAPQPGPVTMADLTVADTLRFVVGLLAQQAWIRLGLQVTPGQSEPAMDLAQARLAIDTLEAVVQQLTPNSDEAERRELASLLADLRVNYVKKAG